MIKFNKTVLKPVNGKQVVQTVPEPATFENAYQKAHAFLANRKIREIKPVYQSASEYR